MSDNVQQDSEATALIEALRAELAGLLARYSRLSNARGNMFNSARICSLRLNPDFTVASYRNTSRILGPVHRGHPAGGIIGTGEAKAYFDGFQKLAALLPELAAATPEDGWSPVYPLESDETTGFANWHSMPAGAWYTSPHTAETLQVDSGELYLMSPRALIGPGEDFRIEYKARCGNSDPEDLSLVIGSSIPQNDEDIDNFRPDSAGYCFAFGAMDNFSTQIQRAGEALVENRDVRISPTHSYECVAERIGGVLKFTIDGNVCCSAVDCLPLMHAGGSHVGFYSCASRHLFNDLRVYTRPTCLDAETLRLMDSLRRRRLEIPNGPVRHVEALYIQNFHFMFRDVTEAEEEKRNLLKEKEYAARMEELIRFARATAHEINQPLTMLSAYIELIQQRKPQADGTPVLPEELANLSIAVKRLADIADKLATIRERSN